MEKKKNTLLYLNENLVKLAKLYGLNLSDTAESALRETLFPHLSAGERQMFFDQHLADLQMMGSCYKLPFELEAVELKNVGPIDGFKARFATGTNVVVSSNGDGKTTMFRAIAHAFGAQTESRGGRTVLLKEGRSRGEIKVKVRGWPLIKLELGKEKESHPKGCMIVDEPLCFGMVKNKHKFVRWLGRMGDQTIIFTRDESFVVPSVHVIRLPITRSRKVASSS